MNLALTIIQSVGVAAVLGVLVQLGRLIERLDQLAKAMDSHQKADESKFEHHAGQLGDLGQRIAHLEGAAAPVRP